MKAAERLWTIVCMKIGLTISMDRLVGKGLYSQKCVFGISYYRSVMYGGVFIKFYLGIVKLVFYYWRPEDAKTN